VSERDAWQAMTSNKLSERVRKDKRQELRHTIALPVRVAGSDSSKGHWSELAETVNVSSEGVALRLSKKVMIGDILFVEIELPERFQKKDIERCATLKTDARVLYVEMHERQQIVRLQFVRQPTRNKTILVSVKF
jgi:PilZ domain